MVWIGGASQSAANNIETLAAGPAISAGQTTGPARASQTQAEYVGRVSDALTGEPVPQAEVRAAGVTTRTDDDGQYRLAVEPGRYAVRFAAPGFVVMTYPNETVLPGQPAVRDAELVRETMTPGERSQLTQRLPRYQAESLPPDELNPTPMTDSLKITRPDLTETPATIRVLMTNGSIVELETDDYLKGVVPFEIGPNAPMEAQKAQAVAARTYAATRCIADSAGDPTRCEPGLDANVDTTTRTQVWRPSPRYDTSNRAVDATSGVVLRENGRLATATVYFARTYFATRNNDEVFNGPPYFYLRSVASPDPFNRRYGHGVGMSQEGAMVFGDWGARYEDILRHYYRGLSVDYAPAVMSVSPTPTPTQVPLRPVTEQSGAEGEALSGRWTITGDEWSMGQTTDNASVVGGRLKALTPGRVVRYTSTMLAGAFEFQALAVEWAPAVPPGSSVFVEARLSQDGKTWDEWREVHPLDGGPRDETDRSTGLLFGLGRFAQIRLTLDQGLATTPIVIDKLTILYYDGRNGPSSAELATQYKASGPMTLNAIKPPIIPRSVWGAPETYVHWNDCFERRGYPVDGYIKPNAMAVHHSADDNRGIDGAAWVRIVYQFHAVGRGWGDIGYHYVVDRDGLIYQGRTPGAPPAGYMPEGGHALQYNCVAGSVMALGNYQPGITVPLVPLTQGTRDGLVRTLAWLMYDFGVRPWDQRAVIDKTVLGICGHRDLLNTSCPGQTLYDELDTLRDRVQAILSTQATPTALVFPTPTATVSPPTATPRPPQPRPATPVATPTLSGQCMSLVAQGDFTQSDRWTLSSAGAFVTASSALSPPSGLFLGRTAAQADVAGWASATQSGISLPANIQRARLSFWYAPFADGADDDRHVVELQDVGGRTLPDGKLIDQHPPQNYRGWAYVEADVTASLQAISPGPSDNQRLLTLYFGVYNDGNGLKSFMRVDDVVLEVCAGPTPTPTATATRTPTRTPPPTPTPAPITCSEWSINGSFEQTAEASPVGWTLQNGLADVGLTDENHTPGGAWAIRLGRTAPGVGMGFAAAWQDIPWPSGVLSATLSLAYRASGGDAGDTRVVEFRDVTVGDRVALLTLDGSRDTGWQTVTLPLTARPEGHTGQVYFAVLDGGGLNAQFLIDDVSLRLCGRGLGGPYRVFLPHTPKGR